MQNEVFGSYIYVDLIYLYVDCICCVYVSGQGMTRTPELDALTLVSQHARKKHGV